MIDNWVCYLILSHSTQQTYVGASNNATKRLQNHNKGRGAKRTKGQTWSHVLVISGFDCKQSCLSFEAGWKRLSKYRSNKKLVNLVDKSEIELKYTNHTIWNRFLDLFYFVYNFTFISPKFILNRDLNLIRDWADGRQRVPRFRHPVHQPDNLLVTCHMPNEFDFILDLDWPDFIEIKIDK
jgi:predicted GIY-YIG superfamily endonuclease